MDSGSTDTGISKDKRPKRHKANEGEDIISKLPESLLSRILSILPTKDAVRTGVLSKRCIYLWRSITKLDLDDTVFYSPKRKSGGKQYFANFVTRALLLTHCSSMESFSLYIGNKYDASLFNTWISSILSRSLINLCIQSQMELTFTALASQFLFNSKLLEELVLNLYRCAAISVPTSHVHFRHLKLLKLCRVTFTLDSFCYLKDLSLTFPVLQKFEAIDCAWLSSKCVTFKVPLLESVKIEQNPESLFYEQHNCAIWFCALRLKEFTYCACGYIPQDIMLLHLLARHASANIILSQCKKNKVPESGDRACLLLKQLCQVKYLNFEGLEVLTQSKVAALPAFKMLSHLELGLVTGEVLLGFLLKAPVLGTLIFKGLLSNFDKEILNSAVVPDCLQSTLQVVKFGEVHAREHELCLAKFFMENGLVLERMSFSLGSWLSKSKAVEEFKEKLFSVKKGFSFAIVEFSYD